MKRPYASINDTCASGNQCEKNVDLTTVLTYPKLEKKEFGIQFVPPTYGYDSKTVTVPGNTVEGFLNPFGMGPIDEVSPEAMEQQAQLARIRIDSNPSVVQDDPTQVLLADNNMATLSNTPIVFPTYKETFEMPTPESYSSRRNSRNKTLASLLIIAVIMGGVIFYSRK